MSRSAWISGLMAQVERGWETQGVVFPPLDERATNLPRRRKRASPPTAKQKLAFGASVVPSASLATPLPPAGERAPLVLAAAAKLADDRGRVSVRTIAAALGWNRSTVERVVSGLRRSGDWPHEPQIPYGECPARRARLLEAIAATGAQPGDVVGVAALVRAGMLPGWDDKTAENDRHFLAATGDWPYAEAPRGRRVSP